MKTMMGYEHPIVPPPDDYKGDFFSDIQNALVGVGLILREDSIYQLDKDYNNMSKFLNRILGMPVELQNRLFKYFTDTLTAIISQAKRTGKYDMGILGEYIIVFSYKLLVKLQSKPKVKIYSSALKGHYISNNGMHDIQDGSLFLLVYISHPWTGDFWLIQI